MQSPTRPLAFRSTPDAPVLGRPRRRNIVREWKETLGAYIADLRNARGMSGQELADAAGMGSRQFISAIETGQTSVPPERVVGLADALNVPRAEFAATVLRYQNPWIYAELIGADDLLRQELEDAARVNLAARGPRPRKD